MNTVTRWTIQFLVDAAVASLFFTWKAYGIEGAGNVVLAYFWFVSIVTLLGLLALKKEELEDLPDMPWLAAPYWTLTTVIEAAALCWYAHFALGPLYLFTGLAWIGKRSRIQKARAARQAAA